MYSKPIFDAWPDAQMNDRLELLAAAEQSDRLLGQLDACDYRDGQDGGGDPVDDGAERWPPSGVGDELGVMLPKVLQAVAG